MSNYKGKSDRKIHDKAIGKEHQSTGWIKKISIVFLSCILALTLATPMLHADDLEIGPEIVGQPVRQSTIPAPTINKVFYDATTISGGNVQRGRVDGKTVRSTVYVTLTDKDGNEKATVSVTPRSGTTWTVNLPAGVTVAKGDTVTAYQEFNGNQSTVVTANAEPSKAFENKDKLKMPEGEIWIEQYVANIVNTDENVEAIKLLKNANPDIEGDIKSVEFKITGIDPKTALYVVTYTDNSKTGEIQAPNLTIKQVKETSRTPEIDSITIVDNVIKGKLAGEGPFDGIKVQLVLRVNKDKLGQYCNENKCTVDKDSSNPVGVTLQDDGTFSYTLKSGESLELDQIVGVSVKEPHKFVSCSTTTVKPATVEKTEVRDPKKLTKSDKEKIVEAIKAGYTVDGVSKLPNGTGFMDGVPAVIQIDDSGNAKIFSGNDVAGDWDSEGNYIPEKNGDGSYKVKDGVEPKITIPAKDLLKNIAPKSPVIAVDTNKGEVTITPPAYKDPGDDTDLLSYTVTYKDADGNDKTITATRDLDTNKWSGTGVDADTGVITLSVEDIELAGTIKATAKDNGGLEGDTDKLDSVEESKKLETATVSYDANKGTGKMDSKELNKGSKYKILANAFTGPANQEFKAWEVDGKEVAAGTEITVTKDTVVKAVWKKIPVTVSYDANGGSGEMKAETVDKGSEYTVLPNAFKAPDDTQEFDTWEVNGKKVAPGTKIKADKDTVIKAIWKKIPVTVSYDANGGSGEMKAETVDKGSEYTVLPNAFKAPDDTQEFDTWEVNGKKVAPGTKIKADKDTVIKAIWKKIPVTVSYDANGGSGEMKPETMDKGSEYTVLPNAFKAPDETQEFDTWEVNGEKVAPGAKIKADKDTVIKAVWKSIGTNIGKNIMVKITYDPNGGHWNNDGAKRIIEVKKGTIITIMDAPAWSGYTFQYWKGSEYQPGDSYTANEDHTFVAQWKPTPNSPVTPADNPNNPQNPNTPGNPNTPAKPGTKAPKTGDVSVLSLFASGILAAGGAVALLKKRREER